MIWNQIAFSLALLVAYYLADATWHDTVHEFVYCIGLWYVGVWSVEIAGYIFKRREKKA